MINTKARNNLFQQHMKVLKIPYSCPLSGKDFIPKLEFAKPKTRVCKAHYPAC